MKYFYKTGEKTGEKGPKKTEKGPLFRVFDGKNAKNAPIYERTFFFAEDGKKRLREATRKEKNRL